MYSSDLFEEIHPLVSQLESHKIYSFIDSYERLQFFMERHVFAVFDFMSLAKSLQMAFAPSTQIWLPPQNSKLARFMNEIILCEESDKVQGHSAMSHFEMYCMAMDEVGANSQRAIDFVEGIKKWGLEEALLKSTLPISSIKFMTSTFNTVNFGQSWEIAASFCFGREKAIPGMFKKFIEKMGVSNAEAPMFFTYLNRHIEVDGDSHGPLAIEMLEELCGHQPHKWQQAKIAAVDSLNARIQFWDEVIEEIKDAESFSFRRPGRSEKIDSMLN